jgi:DNA-binding NarL/FixJ family response regulator
VRCVPAPRRVRVLLVDDNAAVARQVGQVLSRAFETVGVLESGDRLMGAIDRCQPDIVVLDITMPGQNGVALASQLTRSGCRSKIVILTVHGDGDYVRSTFAAGANAYVVKSRLSLDLETALWVALDGGQFVSPDVRMD